MNQNNFGVIVDPCEVLRERFSTFVKYSQSDFRSSRNTHGVFFER